MYSFPIVLHGAIIIIKRNYYETRKRKEIKLKYNEYSFYLTFFMYA